jgi:hypothetical protein
MVAKEHDCGARASLQLGHQEQTMKQLGLGSLAMLGVTGLALGSISVGALALTADNVICTGCVASVDILDNSITTLDIRNYTVGSADINPNITLGLGTLGGRLAIRTIVNPAALIFEANGQTAGAGIVRVGRGGSADINEDTDLVVIDPDFLASSTEPVMQMDASSGTLILGSGNSTNAGKYGMLYMENGLGSTNVWLYGYGQAYLGSSSHSGYLALDNGSSSWSSINLYGSSGDVINQLNGNGVVKAWARLNADGTVASCYRCDPSAAETRKIAGFTGAYEVDFTPVGTDISGRPWTCSLGTGAVFGASGEISCVQRAGDPSSVFVDVRTSAGVSADQPYTIVVY